MKNFGAAIFAAAMLATTTAGNAEEQIAIAGAGPGSLAYNMAAGLAENTNTKTKQVRVTAESSSGFVENVRLVGRGETELGITSAIQIFEAVRSKGSYAGEPAYTNLRGVAVTHTSSASIVAREGINAIGDLAGKTLSLGPPGSLLGYIGELILDAYDMKGKVKTLRLSVSESSRAFVDGTIDAFVGGPAPYPAVLEASAQKTAIVLPVDVEHIKKMQKSAPVVVEKMPAGIYPWLKKDVVIVGFLGYLVANEKVSANAVYELLKANLSPKGIEYLKANHRTWLMWETPKFIMEADAFAQEGIKLHPGAARYWKEAGVKLPAKIAD